MGWGEPPVGTSIAAGPHRVVPRPPVYSVGSERPATIEGAEKEIARTS